MILTGFVGALLSEGSSAVHQLEVQCMHLFDQTLTQIHIAMLNPHNI
jgi:hypothetical protein